MEQYFFNKPVDIDAVYFKNKHHGSVQAYPKRMVMDDESVTFTESGFQALMREGKRAIKLFYMTDGHNKYKLKHDPEAGQWKLLKVVWGGM